LNIITHFKHIYMKAKNCLIFGGSGQIGRNLIRKLTKNNYRVTVVTRNIHQKSYIIKTQANVGYIDIAEANIFDENKIRELFKKADICINLIGILFEKKSGDFKIIHTDLPDLLSQIAKKNKIQKFIHLSSLGIENALDSDYAKSKLEGEKKIKNNFEKFVILKPSIVYSVDDKFTTRFMTLLSRLPIMPLYYNGNTKFNPIHVSDLVDIILNTVENKNNNLVVECIGPEILTFKEIIEKILISIQKKRFLIPVPIQIASLTAKLLQLLPNPLLTEDQLKLLKYDNVSTGLYKTNFDFGFNTKKNFDEEINKYSYNWKIGGQFAIKDNIKK